MKKERVVRVIERERDYPHNEVAGRERKIFCVCDTKCFPRRGQECCGGRMGEDLSRALQGGFAGSIEGMI